MFLQGTYAKVKYGKHRETEEHVAIKVTVISACNIKALHCLAHLDYRDKDAVSLCLQILDKESLVSSGMAPKIKQEIRILKQLRHPHVVELKEVLASRQQIFMVMELVPGGELFDKIVAEGPMNVSIPCHCQSIPPA